MISRTTFCSAQARVMRLARTGPMPVDLPQPRGFRLDGVENLLAERLDELLRVDGTDAAHHAGAEVLLDSLDRRRRRRLQEPRPELLAVGAVVGPLARGCHPLAGRNHRSVADRRDQVAMATRLSRRTQKPLSRLWKVTLSTRPARSSCVDDCGGNFMRFA